MRSPRFGIGLRSQHLHAIAAAPGALDWLEVLSDNFLDAVGERRRLLEAIREQRPVALHGVSLSIAGSAALPVDYLDALARLAAWIEPVHVSDHLCWTSLGAHQSHDLLPVAYTAEVLDHVVERVDRVQSVLRRTLLLENPTAYVAFAADEMGEAEFFAELCRRSGCGMLLDVNNLFVNSQNLGLDADDYLQILDPASVAYIHLAGHADLGDVRIDTHDASVPAGVWSLYERASRRFPEAGVVIERDGNVPPLEELLDEVEMARSRHRGAERPCDAAASGTRIVADGAAAAGEPDRAGARSATSAALRSAASHDTLRDWQSLQSDFFERIVDRPIGFRHEEDAGIRTLLDARRSVRAGRGLRVYSDAYTASMQRALATNFPALATVLSADDFGALSAQYLRCHPPSGTGFTSLGAGLADFLRDHALEADYGVPREVLAELASLEQARIEVAAQPGDGRLLAEQDLATIASEEWESARFSLCTALRIVVVEHDVLSVVDAVEQGSSPARPARWRGAYLVYRRGDVVRTQAIARVEAEVLAGVRDGRQFGRVCAQVAISLTDNLEEAVVVSVRAVVAAAARGLIAERITSHPSG